MMQKGEEIEQNYVREGSLRSSFDADLANQPNTKTYSKLTAKARSMGSSDNIIAQIRRKSTLNL